MELRVLKYFLMIAREENITRAAQLLHVTQPTLSRQLMQLEEELGCTLLVRGKRGQRTALTPEGRLFRQRARLWYSRQRQRRTRPHQQRPPHRSRPRAR